MSTCCSNQFIFMLKLVRFTCFFFFFFSTFTFFNRQYVPSYSSHAAFQLQCTVCFIGSCVFFPKSWCLEMLGVLCVRKSWEVSLWALYWENCVTMRWGKDFQPVDVNKHWVCDRKWTAFVNVLCCIYRVTSFSFLKMNAMDDRFVSQIVS